MLLEKARTFDTLTMRNMHAWEREKIVMYGKFRPPLPSENDLERQDWERMEHLRPQEDEISQLKSTTPQRVFYIIIGSVLLLLLIVGILGANVFHFW
jgi:hypothetical protein